MKKVKEIMTTAVETLHPAETVGQAARKMKVFDFGSLPVVEDGTVIGALTDRDITLRVTAEGRDPAATLVRDVMTPDVICAGENEDVQQAAELMERHQVRRLPVVDRQKRLVGMISIGKVAQAEDDRLAGRVLKGVVQPASVSRSR
jgi:CBS domain-containing protein